MPAGYIAAEFLKFSQDINTPYKVQDYLAPKLLYIDSKIWRNDPNGGMWLSLLGYNHNEQYVQRISIAGKDYNTSMHNIWACQWVAPDNRGYWKYQGQVDFSRRNKVLYKNSTVDINGIKTESPLNGTGNHEGGAVIFINQPTNYTTMQLYRASYAENDVKFFDYLPCISSNGKAVLYNTVDGSELSINSFIAGFTLPQARKLGKLPATGGTLAISLPEGYESDEGVANALETARSNGWTLTVQTYTPENAAEGANTFTLRRVWVRRAQDEQGGYVDADSTRWMVDWCVDMLTPDGSTPDLHGYELFRSTDAAVAYWELTPWVAPEAEQMM